jgi:AmiR/NasT family two-component response regulator
MDERQEPMATLDVRSHRVALAADIISTQANCTAAEAILRMRDLARSASRTVEEIAVDVVKHRLVVAPAPHPRRR